MRRNSTRIRKPWSSRTIRTRGGWSRRACAGSGCACMRRPAAPRRKSCSDLICLDLRLPDASGLTLCEHIRATPRLRDVPVVVITALTRPIDRAQAEVAGADEYMTKPFRADVLVDSVRELIALSAVAPS